MKQARGAFFFGPVEASVLEVSVLDEAQSPTNLVLRAYAVFKRTCTSRRVGKVTNNHLSKPRGVRGPLP